MNLKIYEQMKTNDINIRAIKNPINLNGSLNDSVQTK